MLHWPGILQLTLLILLLILKSGIHQFLQIAAALLRLIGAIGNQLAT